ncbi:hypothetical protein RHS04_09219 [Rhizoctonia solani]|uniref:CFEM domain-containing protein n=1 Tax=Rhizoctonia solani TaxID=456999 RepID=A0A8H7GYG2_9AGAM|nr:hypothetical protein RHS04_09219 [Rhizoctonia solani]
MRFLLFVYSVLSLFFVSGFAHVHGADQIVLGDLRTIKLFEPSPTSSPTLSPIETETTNTITRHDIPSASQTVLAASFTGDSGTAGGRTCVQDCLARAASQVNCGGVGNFWCVCKKSAYVGKAWDCFGQMRCPGADIGRALADLNAACQPIGRANFQGDEIVESPLVVPESTPVAASFEWGSFDEL